MVYILPDAYRMARFSSSMGLMFGVEKVMDALRGIVEGRSMAKTIGVREERS